MEMQLLCMDWQLLTLCWGLICLPSRLEQHGGPGFQFWLKQGCMLSTTSQTSLEWKRKCVTHPSLARLPLGLSPGGL